MNFTELALSRAGAADLKAFQAQEGIFPSGREDALTVQRLTPYLLGYRRYTIRAGDTFYQLARTYATTVQAIITANPDLDPRRLSIGQVVIVPFGFPVVPTDIPFTSELLALCIHGLTVRYPFLTQRQIAVTAGGRPVTVLKMGRGQRSVLYNAAHHANEWITVPLVMKFIEEYARAVSENRSIYNLSAQQLFRRTQLYLVPLVNPDGVDLVTGAIAPDSAEYAAARRIAAQFPMIGFPDGWKANLTGIDLNLNYPAGWEQAVQNKRALGFDRPAPRDFPGYAPLDQPESAAMVRLTRQVNPRLTLSFHTQGETIYWKYLDREPANSLRIGQIFAQVSGYALEETPFASAFAGYKDWFIQDYDRPGYTVEVGRGQNPLPLTQFDEIYNVSLGILTLGLQL